VRGDQRLLWVPLGLAAVFGAFTQLSIVADDPRLVWTFVSVAAALAIGTAVVAWIRRGQPVALQFEIVKAHWIQAAVQSCIYAYWGYHWSEIRAELPLIAAQAIFLYALPPGVRVVAA